MLEAPERVAATIADAVAATERSAVERRVSA
jgi:hypothetical protein